LVKNKAVYHADRIMAHIFIYGMLISTVHGATEKSER